MNPWYILLIELALIFLTSRTVFQSLFTLLFVITHSQKFSISAISLLFFPGTVLHELSHLISAELLRVRTHGMEFNPEYSGGRLKMGSVKISQSDPIRRFIIGIAPFLVGVSVLLCIMFFYTQFFSIYNAFQNLKVFGISLGVLLIVFIITNTMFSSKKDMEGVMELCVLAVIIFIFLYLLNLHPEKYLFYILDNAYWQGLAYTVMLFLIVPLCINVLVLLITHPITKKYTLE